MRDETRLKKTQREGEREKEGEGGREKEGMMIKSGVSKVRFCSFLANRFTAIQSRCIEG